MIGRGGMATVYRGLHLRERIPVAVKVIDPGPDGLDEHRIQRFAEEVRSVARLRHPCVVHVFDQGRVDAEAAWASEGALVEGSPYLVMELASAGSLAQLRFVPPWPTVKGILLALLEALAHAHARGVIHRDIKPANILLCGPEDQRPGLKLTDFGLAYVGGTESTRLAGTLSYMAPEQIRGDWRAFSPATDLYAMGGLAWRIVSGRPVYPGLSGPDLSHAQVNQQPGALDPLIPVPFGFRQWLECLLAKDPADRYPRAAVAASALLSLGDPSDVSGTPVPVEIHHAVFASQDPGGPRVDPDAIVLADQTTLFWEQPEPMDMREVAARVPPLLPLWQRHPGPAAIAPAGVPSTWRRPYHAQPALPLAGAGLGLLGSRTLPMVGRERERDHLWEVLRVAQRRSRTQVVLVGGPAGSGKTRLARWIGHRAHELGHAEVFRTTCVEGSPGHYLGAFGDHREHARVLNDLRSRAHDRIVYCQIDDIDLDVDALGFLRTALSHDLGAAVFVVTVRDGVHGGAVSHALARLREHAEVSTVPLGPLAPGEAALLIRSLLRLEPTLAAMVEEQARGNPDFAIRLVREWGVRHQLVRTGLGFGLLVPPDVPSDLAGIGDQELVAVRHGMTSAQELCLERAAALGMRVERSTWSVLCGRSQTESRGRVALLDRLVLHGLVDLHPRGFVFRSAFFHRAVVRSAMARGRWARLNCEVARHLVSTGCTGPEHAERLGRHLLAGGEPARAFQALVLGVAHRRIRQGNRPALALLGLAERCLGEDGAGDSDPRRALVAVMKAGLRRLQGSYSEAKELVDRAGVLARDDAGSELLVKILNEQALVAIGLRDFAHADATLREAKALAKARGDELGLAHTTYRSAVLALERGDGEVALRLLDRAAGRYGPLGDELGLADCALSRGQVRMRRGDPEAAGPFREARQIYLRHGAAVGPARCELGLADLDRQRGDLDSASRRYQEAWRRFDAVDSERAPIPLLKLGLVRVLQRRPVDSLDSLQRALRLAVRQDRAWLVGAIHVALLPGLVAIGDWPSFDTSLGEAERCIDETGHRHPDCGLAAERAGEAALDCGDRRRAAGAFRLALQQWTALSRPEAARVADRLAAL